MIKFWSALSFLFASVVAQAAPMQEIIRQPRMMAMGGAGVGLADDEFALFQNPAGLAGDDGRRFKLLGLGVEASWDGIEYFGTSMDAFKNFKIADLNKLMGKDIAIRAGETPIVRLPGFAIAYVVDFQGSLNQFNQANPYFDLGYMTTHGIQAGFGWALKNGRHAHDEIRYGVAGKVLWRKGGFYNVSTAGFLQATNQGKQYVENLVGGFGMGFGADVGFQYLNHLDKQTTVSFGASITDVGGTHFSDPAASTLPMSANLGVGWKKNLDFMSFAVAADLKHLNERTAFSNKTHFGVEVGIPLFDFYLGANQLNPTYGVAFDIWILRVSVVSFAEELGILYHQNTSRKTMLQVDFSLPI
jgi:hypothetical protein